MEFNAPTDWNKAICYEDTLIGSILSKNTCPKTYKGPYEFFNDPIEMTWEHVGKIFKIIWQVYKLSLILFATIQYAQKHRTRKLTYIKARNLNFEFCFYKFKI